MNAETGRVSAVAPPGNDRYRHLMHGLLWSEVFVALGLHCFWILSKSFPLTVDNAQSAWMMVVPFAVMLLLGAGAFVAGIQAALIRLERLFHGMTCLLFAALLWTVVLDNPFTQFLPLATTLYLWSAALSFMLAADLAAHLRRRAAGGKGLPPAFIWAGAALGFFGWAATSCASWTPCFWVASIVLHALLMLAGRSDTVSERSVVRITPSFVVWVRIVTETGFTVAMLLLALLALMPHLVGMGTLEGKYPWFVATFASAAFFAGVGSFLLALRLRLKPAAHVVIIATALWGMQTHTWVPALVLGYAFPLLFLVTRNQCGFCYALTTVFVSFAWLLGLSGFAFSGMVIHFGVGLDALRELMSGARAGAMIVLALWLAASAWKRYCRTSTAEGLSFSVCEVVPGTWLPAAVFVLTFLLVFVPGGCWLVSATGLLPDRVALGPVTVDTPMGVCHAGYSESEEEYRQLDVLGVQAIRADFHWSCFQPEPAAWNFGCKDSFVDTAVKHGTQVIALLDFDNNAVEQDPAGKARDLYIAPGDIPLFLEYARQLVTHYQGRVYAWEIWNEPDIDRFWTGTPEEFYELARRTAEAVRAADPKARIVGTAMTGPLGAWMPPQIDGLHASGALKQADHPACHLYVSDPRHYLPEFKKSACAARRFGHPGSPWVTEVGAPDGGYYPWSTEGGRLAEYVIKAYATATSLGMGKVVWYCLNDADAGSQAQAPIDAERFFGLIGPGGIWKPSAHAYRLFSSHCSHSTTRPDLVKVRGEALANNLRTVLYRRDNGECAVILWYESRLRPWAAARVRIQASGIDGPVTVHDIGSEYSSTLLNDYITVSERPVFLTFTIPGEAEKVDVRVASAAVDDLMAAGLTVLVLYAWLSMLGSRRCRAEA